MVDKPKVDTDEVIRRIVARLISLRVEFENDAKLIAKEEAARAKRENEEAGHG